MGVKDNEDLSSIALALNAELKKTNAELKNQNKKQKKAMISQKKELLSKMIKQIT